MPLAVRSTRRHGIGTTDAPALALYEDRGHPGVVTFFLAGLWHGAGWNFVVFGLVHGTGLCIFRGWRMAGLPVLPQPLAWAATMIVVITGMVLFRARQPRDRTHHPTQHGGGRRSVRRLCRAALDGRALEPSRSSPPTRRS